jgi:hypothetical protein
MEPISLFQGQARAEPISVTLFKGWSRLTTDDHGAMQGKPLQGFFAANTQFISHYEIKLNGESLGHRLSAQLSANEWSSLGALLRSGDTGNLPQGKIPNGSIEMRSLRRIDQGWTEVIFIKNNGTPQRKIHLQISISCPISDQEFSEEMKKGGKVEKGVTPKLLNATHGVGFHFERVFGRRKHAPTEELHKMYGGQSARSGEQVTRALDVEVGIQSGSPSPRVRLKPGKTSTVDIGTSLKGREELVIEFR